MDMSLGCGISHHANHGRPVCRMGKMPAAATAKIVMASAARLMLVRQPWRVRYSTAEISVPAWPMPIQNTKFVMSQAQPIVLELPHTPMPVVTSMYTLYTPSSRAQLATPRANSQALGGLGFSAIQATSLVTARNAARGSPP
jgi:hypothetical protein